MPSVFALQEYESFGNEMQDVIKDQFLFFIVVFPSNVRSDLSLRQGVTEMNEEPPEDIVSVAIGILDDIEIVAPSLAEVIGGEVQVSWSDPS